MDLTHHLRQAIERTHVAFQGLSHPLRIVTSAPDSASPQPPHGLKIDVETEHEGSTRRASSTFTRAELDDEQHVVTTLAAAMLSELQGR
jgi:hypothetical protein